MDVRTALPRQRDKTAAMRDIQDWLISRIARETGCEEVDTDVPFAQFGLGSNDVVLISGELEDLLGLSLCPTLLFDYPTIDALSEHLAGLVTAEPAAPAMANA